MGRQRHMQGVYNMAASSETRPASSHRRIDNSAKPSTPAPVLKDLTPAPRTLQRTIIPTWRRVPPAPAHDLRRDTARQQEILGELLRTSRCALDYELIEVNRRSLEELPRLVRCVVNVDRAGNTHDECGIIVTL